MIVLYILVIIFNEMVVKLRYRGLEFFFLFILIF